MNELKIKITPKAIFDEYRSGDAFKQSLGKKGITEQAKTNERFFVGDQWHGANVGNRPLVRRNIIKRIGEFKMSSVTAAPISVNYTADGVPDINNSEDTKNIEERLNGGEELTGETTNAEISTIMRSLSDYFRITAERLRFDIVKEQALRNAYISGTGVVYTYWDSDIKTGLYADAAKNVAINGDISCEVIDIENIVFGEPNNDNVQAQPYIIVSRRRHIGEVIRQARRNRIAPEDIANIKPDSPGAYGDGAGEHSETEPQDSARVTTMTKFYKKWNKEGSDFKVMCTEVCEKTVIRPPFDIGIKYYPFAVMSWERRRSSIYGESEITNMIPNQIAINRTLTAAVWNMLLTGMPIMVMNGDIVAQDITNEPGQIVKIYGTNEDVQNAIRYVNPPVFQSQYLSTVNEMANSSFSDSGATDVALGTRFSENASAIIQMREAAMQPLQIYMNRFYDFIEQISRIWADFWINLYGNRYIRTNTKEGINYVHFNGDRYKSLVITARVDVGAATLFSDAVVTHTLDNLLERQLITFKQYLERMPAGMIPDVTGLINDLQMSEEQAAEEDELSDEAILRDWAAQQPELYEEYLKQPPETQKAMLAKMRTAYNGKKEEVI